MPPLCKPKDKVRHVLEKRLDVLKGWKRLEKELMGWADLSPADSLAIPEKLDAFLAELTAIDKILKDRSFPPALDGIRKEIHHAQEEVLESIENMYSLFIVEKKEALKGIENLRKVRETAQSYRLHEEKEGHRVDQQG